MTASSQVQEYVARQPQLAWRRALIRGLIRTLGFKVFWNVDITGADNVPDTGPAILMMNHISFIDPILCLGAVTNRYVVPMSKVENLRNPITAPFVHIWGAYTVNRAEIDRKALENSIELLKSGQLILIAPEGTRQLEGLIQPKEGFAYIASKANAVIIPTAISGAIGWERKLKRFQRARIQVNFGHPFRFKVNEDSARVSREQRAAMTEEAMYQLALAVTDTTMRGVYSDLSQVTTDTLEYINPRTLDAIAAPSRSTIE